MRSRRSLISKSCFVFVVVIVSLVSVAAFPVISPEVDLTHYSGLVRRDTHWEAEVSFNDRPASQYSENPDTLRAHIKNGILSKLSPGHTANIEFPTSGTPAFDDEDILGFMIAWTGNGKSFTTHGHIQFVGDKGDRKVMYTVEARVPSEWKATVFFDKQKTFKSASQWEDRQIHGAIKEALNARFEEYDTLVINYNSLIIPRPKNNVLQFYIHWDGAYETRGTFTLKYPTSVATLEPGCKAIESPAGPSTASASVPSINIIGATPPLGSSSGSCGPWGQS